MTGYALFYADGGLEGVYLSKESAYNRAIEVLKGFFEITETEYTEEVEELDKWLNSDAFRSYGVIVTIERTEIKG